MNITHRLQKPDDIESFLSDLDAFLGDPNRQPLTRAQSAKAMHDLAVLNELNALILATPEAADTLRRNLRLWGVRLSPYAHRKAQEEASRAYRRFVAMDNYAQVPLRVVAEMALNAASASVQAEGGAQ